MARVSAIVTLYNGRRYLRECIDSLLAQTTSAAEVIVVDDGSTDGSADEAQSHYGDRILIIRQENAGQAAATVVGIAASTGDFIAINDQDDVWPPDKLEHQLAAFEADPSLEAVFGLSEQFVSPELSQEDRVRFAPREQIMRGEAAQCLLIRRSSYERIGGFDPARHGAYFIEWLGRAKRSGLRSLTLEEIVHRRRLHHDNYGRTRQQDRDRNLLMALRAGIKARVGSADRS